MSINPDIAEEAFWIELDNAFEEKYGKKGHDWLEWQELADSDDLLFQYVTMARDVGYNRGYQDGGNDAIMERNYQEVCQGHPAGPFDPMGETVYCDGSCRKESIE